MKVNEATMKVLGKELPWAPALFPKDVLLAMYHKACCEEPYSFWYLDTTAHNKNDVSWLRWDGGRMVVQDAEESPRGVTRSSGR